MTPEEYKKKVMKEYDEHVDLDPALPLNKNVVKHFIRQSLEGFPVKEHPSRVSQGEYEEKVIKEFDEKFNVNTLRGGKQEWSKFHANKITPENIKSFILTALKNQPGKLELDEDEVFKIIAHLCNVTEGIWDEADKIRYAPARTISQAICATFKRPRGLDEELSVYKVANVIIESNFGLDKYKIQTLSQTIYNTFKRPRVDVEKIEKIVNTELLPFADGEWREEFPKDNYKWDSETIKTHSKRVATAIAEELNGKE